jgi:hypothetical protein
VSIHRLVVAVLLAGSIAAADETPPAVTLARLDAATKALDGWEGTYLMRTSATISRTDGSKAERSESTMRISGGTDGRRAVEVISAAKDGKDVTVEAKERAAKRHADAEKAETKETGGKDRDDEGDDDMSLDLPGADTAGKYRFTPLPAAGDSCGAAFAPAPGRGDAEGLTTGELHWSCATLDPLWIAVSPATKVKHVSEMKLRLELARSGELLYVARTVTDGVGGMLFIKRRFHVETEVSKLSAPPPAAATAP